MDRNKLDFINEKEHTVALRKESVDRNDAVQVVIVVVHVALRKESVDRNTSPHSISCMILTSLSARRAWIEIKSGLHPLMASLVALRKESVDRNQPGKFV